MNLAGADIRHLPNRRARDEQVFVRRRYNDEPLEDVGIDPGDWQAYLALCEPDERADWIEVLGWR